MDVVTMNGAPGTAAGASAVDLQPLLARTLEVSLDPAPPMKLAVFHGLIAPLLYHDGKAWCRITHWGFCGQSCRCCRSHVVEDAGWEKSCGACFAGWVLTTVCAQWCDWTRQYSRAFPV